MSPNPNPRGRAVSPGRLSQAAERQLARIVAAEVDTASVVVPPPVLALLEAADLVERQGDGRLRATAAGHAHARRTASARRGTAIDPFRAQHLALEERPLVDAQGRHAVLADAAESPLLWLARRKGRDGRRLISAVQLQAGERLRSDFTHAHGMPRVTSNWEAPVAPGARGAGGGHPTEAMVAARQRMRRALDAVGPEFAGLLTDVCCFLLRLEDIERRRAWPPRAAKVVLQLGLDRLARHYGLAVAAHGKPRAAMRAWVSANAEAGAAE